MVANRRQYADSRRSPHRERSLRHVKGTSHRVRSDLSATLFFSDPEEYEGDELVIEDTYGIHTVKLSAGHMVLYPSSSLQTFAK